MNPVLEGSVKIGISACLYDCKLRYNGKGWDQVKFLGRERGEFTWFPVCVEVAAGLGVPREAIRLQGGTGFDVWKNDAHVKSASGRDVTRILKNSCDFAIEMLKREGVQAFIYMEGSPSCGVYRTSLKNKRLGKPPGVFGARLLEEGFFLIPGQDLASPLRWWDWRRRLFAFLWLKDQPLHSRQALFEVWHTVKFLCQELDENYSRNMGRTLAALDREDDHELYETWRNEWLMLLRRPSTTEKMKNRLWKHYSFYKKKTGNTLEEIMAPTELRNITHIAKEMLEVEQASRSSEVAFGASPILKKHGGKR